MAKVNIKARLISDDDNLCIETKGIKSKNKIIYKENNVSVTINLFNNKIKMDRVCREYEIALMFEEGINTISHYKVFGMPKVFELSTLTNKLNIMDKKIEIEYELEGNKFSYSLEVEYL